MNNQLFTVIVLVCLTTNGLFSQVISTPAERSDLLEGMNNSLTNVDQEEGDYAEVISPFVPIIVEIPLPVVEQVVEKPKVVAKQLPDEQALNIISEQFAPLGSLILGSRGVLQLPGNRTIEKGASFNAEINGFSYEVQILDVTSKGYTLKLGSAEISKNFLTTSGIAE